MVPDARPAPYFAFRARDNLDTVVLRRHATELVGDYRFVELTALQQGGFYSWNVFSMPFGFVAGIVALQAMLAEKPFDTMIAPSEIASGPMVELSGKFLGLAFLQHSVAIFVETGLIVTLFLGGGSNIGFADGHAKWFSAGQILALSPKNACGCWGGGLVGGKFEGIWPGCPTTVGMDTTSPNGLAPGQCMGDEWGCGQPCLY